VLARATPRGGLIVAAPGRPTRRLLPDGWGVTGVVWAPTGRSLFVGRSLFRPPTPQGARAYRQQLWRIDLGSRRARPLYRQPDRLWAPPLVAESSPDSRSLFFFRDPMNSASLAADGLPLLVVSARRGGSPRLVVDALLTGDDFRASCGQRLVVAAGGGRSTTENKRLVAIAAPAWRPRALASSGALSWISPSCSGDGLLLAAAGGRVQHGTRFGDEHRSIWLPGSRRRLTTPPAGATDELPRWSIDNRILFIRTRRGAGALYLVTTGGETSGPLARVGAAQNYYGHYSWSEQTDWWRRGSD
jgi:hypothetical protein